MKYYFPRENSLGREKAHVNVYLFSRSDISKKNIEKKERKNKKKTKIREKYNSVNAHGAPRNKCKVRCPR